MPLLRVLFWNIQNFGEVNQFRERQSRTQFIAQMAFESRADILLIEELKGLAITTNYLDRLLMELNGLPPPYNNWYFDWILGALSEDPRWKDTAYNTANQLMWDAGHNEGYAVFWNQNIAKFTVQPAPPIQLPPPAGGGAAPAPAANSQSAGATMHGRINFFNTMVPVTRQVPAGGIAVPNVAQPYVLPAGTASPGLPPIPATPVAANVQIPAGTLIGAGGVTLSQPVGGINPVVVPGGYTLTEPLMLPAAPAVLVPQNTLSLAMFGRDSADPATPLGKPATATGNTLPHTLNFQPGVPNDWNWVYFPQGVGDGAKLTGSRRPAYVTIDVNRANNPGSAFTLLPITVYHAPSALTPAIGGTQRAATIQPMYQAYDHAANAWIDCANALLGGDLNVPLSQDRPAALQNGYDAFITPIGPAGGYGGGANAVMAVTQESLVPLREGARGDGPQIYSTNLDNYRGSRIDNAFYRGLGTVSLNATLVPDMLDLVSGNGIFTGQTVQNFLATEAMILGGNITSPSTVAPRVTYQEVIAGTPGVQGNDPNRAENSAARRIAEFYHLFVSDHMPVLIEFVM